MDEKAKNFFKGLVGKSGRSENGEENESGPMRIKVEAGDEEDQAGLRKANDNDDDLNKFEEAEGRLTVDVYQTPGEIVIQSAVAGLSPEDLDIDITSESVTIKGKREREEKVKEEDYFYQECYWGRFSRSVILPQEIDTDRATASLKNGVLTIRLPKLESRKAKKLKVKPD